MEKHPIRYRVMMLFLSNLLLRLMGFAYRAALTRAAGSAAIGLESLLMQIYGVTVSFCISGLNVAVTSLSARAEDSERAAIFRSAFGVFCILFIAAAAPIAAFSSGVCKYALGEPELHGSLLLMLLCIFMTGVENLLKSVHMGAGRAGRCAASELTEQAVRYAAVILLLKTIETGGDPGKVFLIILGMVLSEFVSVGFLSCSFHFLFRKKGAGKARGSYIREIVRTAFPALLTALSGTLFSSLGTLLLPRMLAARGALWNEALSEIGVMNASALPLTMLPMALVDAIAAALMPEVCSLSSRGRDAEKLITRSFIAAGLAGAAYSFLMLMFGTRLSYALFACASESSVFIILTFNSLFVLLQVISVSAMNGLLIQRTVLSIAVISEAYQLVLVMLITPALGLAGYALGLLAGEAFRLALNCIALRSELKKGYGIKPAFMVKSA